MMTKSILAPKILLIESNAIAASKIVATLASAGSDSFNVECVRQLSEGLERLSKRGIAAVLLALSLPDSEGLDTFDKLFVAAPDIPILILGGNDQEALAKQAEGGAAPGFF